MNKVIPVAVTFKPSKPEEFKSFTFEQYNLARCHQIHGDTNRPGNPTFMHTLIDSTGGKVCNNCSWYSNASCEAYKFLMSDRPFSDIQPVFTERVRDEAKRLGLSLSEVRRRRSGN